MAVTGYASNSCEQSLIGMHCKLREAVRASLGVGELTAHAAVRPAVLGSTCKEVCKLARRCEFMSRLSLALG